MKDLKEKGKLRSDFRVILGDELYLVDSIEDVKDNYQSGVTKFPHFVVLAKNRKGFEALCLLENFGWKNSFFTGMMERVPVTREYLKQIVQSGEYKGTLMASSACLGSSQNLILQKKAEAENSGNLEEAKRLHEAAKKDIQWYVDVFGKEDYYIELQPADTWIQRYVNEHLLQFAKELDLKYLVAGDTHYIKKEDASIHEAFLNSKMEEREISQFYAYCFLHSIEDMYKQMAYYLGEEVVTQALETTTELYDKSEDYTLDHSPIIPKVEIPEFELQHLFKRAYDKYPSLKRLAYSDIKDEQYMLYLLEEGYLRELHKPDITREEFHTILKRLDDEMEQILGVGDRINQVVSSYYLSVRDIVNTIWQEDECGSKNSSLVGVGRGSAGGFLSLFLLGVIQINPLEYKNMPFARHLHASRMDFPDVDIDIESKRRQNVIQSLKRKYGDDRVLNVATFTTAGTKSCIKTAARGLGIADTEAQYIASLVPIERGQQYSLNDCLYGNEEKGRKKQTQFINEINKFPKLLETALGLESIIVAKSQHAGGIILLNDEIHKNTAMMKAAKGKIAITQYSLKQSEQMGLVKFDLLSIDGLDKIRQCLDLLIEGEVVEDKGSLKANYNAYIRPNNFDTENKEYFQLASTGSVNSLFQFNSLIGQETLKRIKPETFEQFSAANSLMRLQAQEGKEPPMDVFIKHKENIQTWYDEMKEYGLNQEEIKIMERHVGYTMGVCPVQEQAMALAGDENIANFTVTEQNKLRKAIAKPKGSALSEVKELYFSKGKEQGTSENLLNYVWETQFTPMFSYAFSSIHSNLYSIIGIQNLHLNLFYNPLYWRCGVLNVDSGSITEDSEASVDHTKIAEGIGKAQYFGDKVLPPSINKSKLAFTPDAENNSILYGLKPVKTLNSKLVKEIINNRPYRTLQEVFEKLYDTKLITTGNLVALGKSGALDEFGERKQVMMDIVRHITDTKTNLTMQNIKLLLEANILEGRPELDLILLRESFKNKVIRKEPSGKSSNKIFKVTDTQLYDRLIGQEAIINVFSNHYEISEKEFKKVFDKKTKELKEWLKTEEPIQRANRYALNQSWLKHVGDLNYSRWEMETLSYYYHKHELADVDYELYNIVNYSDLEDEPIIVKYNKWNNREIPIYQLYNIAGTVIGKDAAKHIISLLTTDGSVVTVKYQSSGQYSNYDRTIKKDGNVVSSSWFSRGNKLMIHGFRRGGQFVAKKYADSPTSTTTKLITQINSDGTLMYQTKREY